MPEQNGCSYIRLGYAGHANSIRQVLYCHYARIIALLTGGVIIDLPMWTNDTRLLMTVARSLLQ
jgi:hypothetical protein